MQNDNLAEQYEQVLVRIEADLSQFPVLWRSKFLTIMAECRNDLTRIEQAGEHPLTEFIDKCPQCQGCTLKITGKGAQCSCGYQGTLPLLVTDMGCSCRNCGHPTMIVSEDSSFCVRCQKLLIAKYFET